jgi:multiple sugar transport system permease protein
MRAPRFLRSDRGAAIAFLVPGVAALCITYVYPLAYSAWLSLSNWDLRVPDSAMSFAGLENYHRVMADAGFWSAAGRSLVFTGVSLPTELVFGTLVALLLTSERASRTLSAVGRVALLVPLMLPPVVVGILWRLIFNVRYGPLNAMLGGLGFAPVSWIASPETALWSVILVELFAGIAVVAMILIGGLLSLPDEPIRAAQVDGAGAVRIALEIKLPQLVGYYLIIVLLRVMDLLKTFDFIFAMTSGGPGDATLVLNMYIYRLGSRFLEYTQAAAASWIFLLALLPLSVFLLLKAVAPSGHYLND